MGVLRLDILRHKGLCGIIYIMMHYKGWVSDQSRVIRVLQKH